LALGKPGFFEFCQLELGPLPPRILRVGNERPPELQSIAVRQRFVNGFGWPNTPRPEASCQAVRSSGRSDTWARTSAGVAPAGIVKDCRSTRSGQAAQTWIDSMVVLAGVTTA